MDKFISETKELWKDLNKNPVHYYGGSCSKELVSGTGHITWSKKDV